MTPTLSVTQLQETAAELVSNFLILAPDAPADVLAARIADEADPVFMSEYGRSEAIASLARAIRAAQSTARKSKALKKPAGYELLPLRVKVPGIKHLVPLDRMTAWHATRFRRSLERKFKDDARNKPALVQAKAFEVALQKKAARTKRPDITAGEALGFDLGDGR